MADYYWRAPNGGNWSDLSNWRTTQSGSITPTVVPSTTSNIYFDNNSFLAANDNNAPTSITLTANSNCQQIIFNTKHPVRFKTNIAIADDMSYYSLTMTPTTFVMCQTCLNFLTENVYIDTHVVSLVFNLNAGALPTNQVLNFPGINNTQSDNLNRIVLITLSGTSDRIDFIGDITLSKTQFAYNLNATGNSYIYAQHPVVLNFGAISFIPVVKPAQPTLMNTPKNLIFELSNTDFRWGSVGSLKGIFITMTGATANFPIPIRVRNTGSYPLKVSGTKTSINNYYLSSVEYVGAGGTAVFQLENNTTNVVTRVGELILTGIDPLIDRISIPTSNYSIICTSLTAINMGFISQSPGTAKNLYFNSNTIPYNISKCYFKDITVMPTNLTVKAYDSIDGGNNIRIDFIQKSGQEETVDVITNFGDILTFVERQITELRSIRINFGDLDTNLNTIKKSLDKITSNFETLYTTSTAIGKTAGGSIVQVTTIFEGLNTNTESIINYIGERIGNIEFENINTNINTTIEVPANSRFYDLNTSVTTTTKAIREYDVNIKFDELFIEAFSIYHNPLTKPVRIILDIFEPQHTLDFNPVHKNWEV